MGDDTVTFVRRGLRVVAEAVPGTAARATVVDMRKTHYQSVLDGLGVPTWDHGDDISTHVVCSVDDVPVASIRSGRDSADRCEAVEAFPELAATLPAEFVYLSRQLVVPEFRGLGLSAMLVNAAANWWLSRSPLDYVVAASRESTAGNARVLGGTILAAPALLGPDRVPVSLMGASLATLAERTATVLDRHEWQAA